MAREAAGAVPDPNRSGHRAGVSVVGASVVGADGAVDEEDRWGGSLAGVGSVETEADIAAVGGDGGVPGGVGDRDGLAGLGPGAVPSTLDGLAGCGPGECQGPAV